MSSLAKSVGADPSVYKVNQLLKLPGQSKRKDPRVQAIITGELHEHIVTAFFDEDARPMDPEAQAEAASGSAPPPRPRSTLTAQRRAAALSPWTDSPNNIPEEWAMSAPALQTLALVKHKPEPPHRLPASVRYMIMGWCRAR
jgi:hypothetical protein